MSVFTALRRHMGIKERRVRFAKLRQALDGADHYLIDKVRSLDALDQGELDSMTGPALRELAKMQGEAAEVQQDELWNSLAGEVERMKLFSKRRASDED